MNNENNTGGINNQIQQENNTIAIIGFIFSFLFALVGLICSIIGYRKAKKINVGKGLSIAGIIISSISIVINLMAFGIIFSADFVSSLRDNIDEEINERYCSEAYDCISNNNGTYTCKYIDDDFEYENIVCKEEYINIKKDDNSNINQDIIYSGKKGTTYYINKLENNRSYISSSKVSDVKYVCETNNCNVFDVSEYGKFIVGYDNFKYFIYDLDNDKKRELKVQLIPYSDIEILEDQNDNIIGLFLSKSIDDSYTYTTGYYDLEKQKMLVNFGKYSTLDSDYISIKKGILIYRIGDNADTEYGILNINDGKNTSNGINKSFIVKDKVYYAITDDMDETIMSLYNDEMKLLYGSNGETMYYSILDDKISLYDNSKFYIYNSDGLNYTSSSYNKIIFISSNYVVVDENNKLVVKKIDETNSVILTELEDDYFTHLSGIRNIKGKKAIVIPMINENNITEQEKQEYISRNPNMNSEGLCYHYYYIIDTGETGKYVDYNEAG